MMTPQTTNPATGGAGQGSGKNNQPLNNSTSKTPRTGSQIANEMIDALWTSKDQAEAVRHLMVGLESAFNPYGDLIVRAVSGGFAVGIVNQYPRSTTKRPYTSPDARFAHYENLKASLTATATTAAEYAAACLRAAKIAGV